MVRVPLRDLKCVRVPFSLCMLHHDAMAWLRRRCSFPVLSQRHDKHVGVLADPRLPFKLVCEFTFEILKYSFPSTYERSDIAAVAAAPS